MKHYLKVLQDYATFSGRARRSEFWYFYLFSTIFALIAMLLDNMTNSTFGDTPYGLLYGLAVFIPGLAVTVRRLHDVGKSGWMYFVALIPIAGGIWLLVLLVTEGESGVNKY